MLSADRTWRADSLSMCLTSARLRKLWCTKAWCKGQGRGRRARAQAGRAWTRMQCQHMLVVGRTAHPGFPGQDLHPVRGWVGDMAGGREGVRRFRRQYERPTGHTYHLGPSSLVPLPGCTFPMAGVVCMHAGWRVRSVHECKDAYDWHGSNATIACSHAAAPTLAPPLSSQSGALPDPLPLRTRPYASRAPPQAAGTGSCSW